MHVVAWPAFKNRPYNPYNWFLYTQLAELGVQVREFTPSRVAFGPMDVFHVHWPERFFNWRSRLRARLATRAVLSAVDVARVRGAKVVWTAHNLRAHEGYHPDLEALFWPAFLRRVDAWISLSRSAHAEAEASYPALSALPSAVIPIGSYRGEYPDEVPRDAACRQLGLDPGRPVVLFFGLIRPYKGVPDLVRTVRRLDHSGVQLVVAGTVSDMSLARDIREAAAGAPDIHIHLGFVPAERIQVFMRAADLVVLPFTQMLNSSSVLAALAFDRPVLASARESLVELAGRVGAEWVRIYDGALSPEVLADAVHWARDRAPMCPVLPGLDWATLARATRQFYASITG